MATSSFDTKFVIKDRDALRNLEKAFKKADKKRAWLDVKKEIRDNANRRIEDEYWI